jgi:hypothetical protein
VKSDIARLPNRDIASIHLRYGTGISASAISICRGVFMVVVPWMPCQSWAQLFYISAYLDSELVPVQYQSVSGVVFGRGSMDVLSILGAALLHRRLS